MIRKLTIAVFLLTLGFINISFADIKEDFVKALDKQDVERVRFLINEGADVNDWMIDEEGTKVTTPLSWAAFHGNMALTELLIEKGANLNVTDAMGNSALHWAAINNEKEVVKLLLDKGADVNVRNCQFGKTPLMSTSSTEVVKILIAAGADINAKDNDGSTALDEAIRDQKYYEKTGNKKFAEQHKAIVELLKAKGGK